MPALLNQMMSLQNSNIPIISETENVSANIKATPGIKSVTESFMNEPEIMKDNCVGEMKEKPVEQSPETGTIKKCRVISIT